MVDSHCHLADAVFAPDLEAVVARAKEAGVEQVLVILEGGNQEEAAHAERLQSVWAGAYAAVGVHPHIAHQYADAPDRAAETVATQLATTVNVRAIGEIGLDYHYDFSPRDVQQQVFRLQLRLAREQRLPVVIHTREADDDTEAILREEGGGDLRGVIHCFTGTTSFAHTMLGLGFYISAAGIVTFPKADALRDTIRDVPLDRLLTETDSPFLAPAPYRGHRNEPAYVTQVVAALAALHGMGAEVLASRTAANFHTLFGA